MQSFVTVQDVVDDHDSDYEYGLVPTGEVEQVARDIMAEDQNALAVIWTYDVPGEVFGMKKMWRSGVIREVSNCWEAE